MRHSQLSQSGEATETSRKRAGEVVVHEIPEEQQEENKSAWQAGENNERRRSRRRWKEPMGAIKQRSRLIRGLFN